MGGVGSAFDNAMAESFYASLQTELLDRRPWATRALRRTAIVDDTEIFVERTPRHSRLDELLLLDDEAPHQTRTSLTTARLQPVQQTG